MQTIKAGEGQTLIDVAMQHLGEAALLFDVAELNGLQITDELTPGQLIILPDAAIDKLRVVREFSSRGLEPSSLYSDDVFERLQGIDYWAIEDDFIVQ